MPELPEVETTRRGILPAVMNRRIRDVIVREPRLRWRVIADLKERINGQKVLDVRRRAKYLLIDLDRGSLIVHLGMSGNLRVLPASTPLLDHDHLDVVLDSDQCLRFNDPRRFGSVHWTEENPFAHRLLEKLAPEPLDDGFDASYLSAAAKHRQVSIKQLLMNSQVVVGVGNIYASESLFRAGIRPTRPAGRVTRAQLKALVEAIRAVLSEAIQQGGTTLRDYVNASGAPGYFRQELYVYERAGEPCRVCRTPIKQITQGQRSTYYCPKCQT